MDPEDENAVARPLFGFLSQPAVAAEVACNTDPFPQVGSVSTLRSTWRSHSDFIADPLSFALWSEYQPTHCDPKEVLDIIEDLIDGLDFIVSAGDGHAEITLSRTEPTSQTGGTSLDQAVQNLLHPPAMSESCANDARAAYDRYLNKRPDLASARPSVLRRRLGRIRRPIYGIPGGGSGT